MLSKRQRLTRNQFDRVFSDGKTSNFDLVRLKYLPADDFRVAVVVSKKVSKGAVSRIRLRRRFYGALPSPALIGLSGWYILFIKPNAIGVRANDIASEMGKIFK